MYSRTRQGLIYSIDFALRTTSVTLAKEKMLIIATRRNGKLYLLANLLKFGQKSNFLIELTVRTIIMLVTQNVLI